MNKFLSLLGMARRAGAAIRGRDACVEAVKSGKAKICFISSDSSERLEREFTDIAAGKDIEVIRIPYTMTETGFAVGSKKVGVLTLNDLGFAKRAKELLTEQNEKTIREDDSHDE